MALLQMLLTVTENGWSNIVYDYGYKYSSMIVSALFFNSFFSITVFIILSLLVGLIWEIFLIISEHIEAKKPAAEDQEDKEKNSENNQDSDDEESEDQSLEYDFENSNYMNDEDIFVSHYRQKLYHKKVLYIREESINMERDTYTDDSSSSENDQQQQEADLLKFEQMMNKVKNRSKSTVMIQDLEGEEIPVSFFAQIENQKSKKKFLQKKNCLDQKITLNRVGSLHKKHIDIVNLNIYENSVRSRLESRGSGYISANRQSIQGPDSNFRTRLRFRVETLNEFMGKMYNFDVDIITYINPEKCYYRDIFLQVFKNKKVEEENKVDDVFNEDAILGGALIKEDEKEKMYSKENKILMKMMDSSSDNVDREYLSNLFTMHDSITTMIIRAIRYPNINKANFLGALYRQMRNINTHLMNYGGLFQFVIVTRNSEFISFEYDEKTQRFVSVDAENDYLKAMNEFLTDESGPLIIDDLFWCENTADLNKIQENYDRLFQQAGKSDNQTFRYCKPHQNVWTSMAVKIENPNFIPGEAYNAQVGENIQSLIMYSYNLMYTSSSKVSKRSIKHVNFGDPKENLAIYQRLEKLNKFIQKSDIEKDLMEKKLNQDLSNFLLSYLHHTQFIQNLTLRMTHNRVQLFQKLNSILGLIEENEDEEEIKDSKSQFLGKK